MATSLEARIFAGLSLGMLIGSASLIALAPLLMPPDYNWVAQSISESGAQQVTGAWATRLGFLLLGAGVLVLTRLRYPSWRPAGSWLLLAYGVLMLCVAAFSTASWNPEVASNQLESNLHSIAATVMGFCYGLGIFLIAIRKRVTSLGWRVFSFVVVVSSFALPLAAWVWTDTAGILQRLMFALAYIWFIHESVLAIRQSHEPSAAA